MNKRFLSTLLFGALFIASTSVFVSCKDYDDDISNLQAQIDKAALKSELTALQTQLTNASTNAEAAMKNLEEKLAKQAAEQNASNADLQNQINAVKAAADEAAKDLAAKIEAAAKAAADAQQAAGEASEQAKAAAQAAKEAAEQAVAEAVAKLNAENAELRTLIANLGTTKMSKEAADELKAQIEELKNQIAHMDGAAEVTAAYRAAVDELYKAITSIEIIDSFTGYDFLNGGYYIVDYDADGNPVINYYWFNGQGKEATYYANDGYFQFPLTHGFIPADATFGDNELNYKDIDGKEEIALPLVKYTKGADIKDPTYGLIVRVNPVNVDLTTSDIRLINSLGEDLSDYVKVGTPERYHTLYTTRANMIDNGLWILPFEVAKGIDEKAFLAKTTVGGYLGEGVTSFPLYDPDRQLLYAVAVNNTQTSEAERYVISSYDVSFTYNDYVPANHFTFNVNNREGAHDVNFIKNRYLGAWADPCIYGETGTFSKSNYELEWLPTSKNYPAPTAVPVKDNKGANYQNNNDIWDGVGCWMSDARFGEDLLVVGVGETFSISNIKAYTEYGNEIAIDSIYVVLDKHNAVESHPSEINAWESYKIEGLNKTVTAAKGIELKINDKRADGDVIGFRVFAVNRDGSLVDPDGRAFYVYVADEAPDNALSATVTATVEGNTDTSTEMDTNKKWNNLYKYVLTIDPATNPKVVVGKNATANADLSYFQFNWDLNNNGTPKVSAIYAGTSADLGTGYLKNSFKKLTITPQNIENLIDGATYTFKLIGYEVIAGTIPAVEIPRTVTLITLTKLMPTKAKELTFRPKQEVEDGSGKVIAYMIPNKVNAVKNAWVAPWTTIFAPHATVTEMEACYDASGAKADNGFKNLTNIFYNLSQNGQNGRDKNPAKYDENEWDKTYHFVFGTSDKDGKKDLVDAQGEGISWEHPGTAYDPLVPTTQGEVEKYMLDVKSNLIPNVNTIDEVIKDDKNWHAVKTSTVYPHISSKLKADGTVDCFAKNYPVANGQNFQFAYACWHHANSFAWKAATAQPKLKWSHEGKDRTSPFTDIVSKNSYDPAFFGDGTATATSKTLKTLADKNFLIGTDKCALYTEQGGKGQKNPYYVPSIAGTTITYKQASTQTDAAPVADHTEYLRITMKDAFDHDVVIELPVTIQRP